MPVPGGRHVGRGTANYLVGLGPGCYLEIIGPDPEAVDPPVQLPFGLELITSSRLLTWAIGTPGIDAAIASARARGYDPGDATAMSRATVDGQLLEWRLTPDTVRSGGGVAPFLIDWGATAHPSAGDLPQLARPTLTAQSPEPDGLRADLGALGIELPITLGATPRLQATVRTGDGDLVLA